MIPFFDPFQVLLGEALVEVEVAVVLPDFCSSWGESYLRASKVVSLMSLAQSMR